MFLIGAAAAWAISWSMPRTQTSSARNGIDEFMPAFQFREQHAAAISAPPARVFEAIRTVSADEIALFQAFTWIRRFGQPGPESIMNAPGSQAILDVATRSGFLLLQDRPPHEVVIGTIVVAPPRARRPERFGPDEFKRLTMPGLATATMNFRVEDAGGGTSRLVTETRVFATDRTALRRFTPYWRIIFPGSAILRITWSRAIRARAERPS